MIRQDGWVKLMWCGKAVICVSQSKAELSSIFKLKINTSIRYLMGGS